MCGTSSHVQLDKEEEYVVLNRLYVVTRSVGDLCAHKLHNLKQIYRFSARSFFQQTDYKIDIKRTDFNLVRAFMSYATHW